MNHVFQKKFFYESLCTLQEASAHGYEVLLAVAQSEEQRHSLYSLPISSNCWVTNETLRIDFEAQNIYPDDAPVELVPTSVIGDGNCLFRSFSVMIFGNEDHHIEMRTRAAIELLCNFDFYLSEQCLFCSHSKPSIFWIAHYSRSAEDSFLNMNDKSSQRIVLWSCIKEALTLNTWVGMWHVCSLASVCHSCVRSIYPADKVQIACNSQVRKILNTTIFPRLQSLPPCSVYSVLWSRIGLHNGLWQPNHFVPCIKLESNQQRMHKPKRSFFNTNIASIDLSIKASQTPCSTFVFSYETNLM